MPYFITVIWFLVCAALLAGIMVLATHMSDAEKRGRAENEQCIVWKHEQNAEKFVKNDCHRYVNYNL